MAQRTIPGDQAIVAGGEDPAGVQLLTKPKIIIFAIVFALIGGGLLIHSRAASVVIATEPEAGVLTAGATVGADTTASGGKYVQFGSVATPPPPTSGFYPRGIYGDPDTSPLTSTSSKWATYQSLGFNLVNASDNKTDLDWLAARNMKALIWLGDYQDTCQFEYSDTQVTNMVNAIKGHSAIYAYFIADEPEQQLKDCPNQIQQLTARSNLVHQLDPGKSTYEVISNSRYSDNSGTIEWYPYKQYVGATDIMGLDIYPCHWDNASACDYSDIDKAITTANNLKIPHYLAILQDFRDLTPGTTGSCGVSNWRYPTINTTTNELRTQFDHWDASGMQGYAVFSWSWCGFSLDGRSADQAELQYENARVF
ncbi:MAG TPA: hypothetical protein VLH84_02465 [Patescibacteria group bacterium]|nr:hypothetical protein [Patescibacteria group bacterium]